MYGSRSYRYNGRVFPILKNLLLGDVSASSDGYLPAQGTFDPKSAKPRHGMNDVPRGVTPSAAAAIEVSQQAYSPLRVRLLRELAQNVHADKSRLFLVHAPIWDLPEEAHANWLRRVQPIVASMPGTQFVDLCEFAYPDTFGAHPELMHDFNHLNEAGARLFSTLLAQRLKTELGAPSAASSTRSIP
jgi:hypothetical protein